MSRGTLPSILLWLWLVSAAIAGAEDPPAMPWLKVSGTRVVEADTDKPVRLRGVCFDRFYFSYREDPQAVADYADTEDVARLAADGVTLIRLGFHPDEVLGDPATVKRDLQRIDRLIQVCARNRVYVILDLRLPPGNEDIDPIDGAFWDDPTQEPRLRLLWTTLAERYKDEPAVLGYDLFNEPTPPDPERWWTLCAALVATVRAVDPRHVLVIEPPLLEGAELRTLADPQVLYSVHFYEPLLFTHQGADWIGDVPFPMDVNYPGEIPSIVELESSDGPGLEGDSETWVKLESEEVTAPKGATWLAIGLWAGGEVGQVWFDDVELTADDKAVAVPNGGFEEASIHDDARPRLWQADENEDGDIEWSTDAHSGKRSVSLRNVDEERTWTNWNDPIPEYYVPVHAGGRYRMSLWVKAKENRGAVGAVFHWLERRGEAWNRARLAQDLAPILAWGREHGVPLYIGEIGATRANPAAAAAYLLDVAGILNEADVPWTLWTYRDPRPEPKAGGFGLLYGPEDGPSSECRRNEDLWTAFRKALR